mmetsp:Transcript_59055/g.108573  ORF Transcript_59055/g.108573 Transcript_59055/m.108573 type:complete len:221 (-) Transcript_59055:82-744(-)
MYHAMSTGIQMANPHITILNRACHRASFSARFNAVLCETTNSLSSPNMLEPSAIADPHACAATSHFFCFAQLLARPTKERYVSGAISGCGHVFSRTCRRSASACINLGVSPCSVSTVASPYIVAMTCLPSLEFCSNAFQKTSSASGSSPRSMSTTAKLCNSMGSFGRFSNIFLRPSPASLKRFSFIRFWTCSSAFASASDKGVVVVGNCCVPSFPEASGG